MHITWYVSSASWLRQIKLPDWALSYYFWMYLKITKLRHTQVTKNTKTFAVLPKLRFLQRVLFFIHHFMFISLLILTTLICSLPWLTEPTLILSFGMGGACSAKRQIFWCPLQAKSRVTFQMALISQPCLCKTEALFSHYRWMQIRQFINNKQLISLQETCFFWQGPGVRFCCARMETSCFVTGPLQYQQEFIPAAIYLNISHRKTLLCACDHFSSQKLSPSWNGKNAAAETATMWLQSEIWPFKAREEKKKISTITQKTWGILILFWTS